MCRVAWRRFRLVVTASILEDDYHRFEGTDYINISDLQVMVIEILTICCMSALSLAAG
jgi:hypothetical protein